MGKNAEARDLPSGEFRLRAPTEPPSHEAEPAVNLDRAD